MALHGKPPSFNLVARDAEQPTLIEVAPSLHRGEDPMQPLSAAGLGHSLGVSETIVRQRDDAGELFSIVFPARGPERLYPAFQVWEDVAGQPLKAVLHQLKVRELGGAIAYAFFILRDDILGYLTPVELLIGSVTSLQRLEQWVIEGLNYPAERRLEIVLQAARNHVGVVDGW